MTSFPACEKHRLLWSPPSSPKKVPAGDPSSPLQLVLGETGVAIGERSKQEEGVKEEEEEEEDEGIVEEVERVREPAVCVCGEGGGGGCCLQNTLRQVYKFTLPLPLQP